MTHRLQVRRRVTGDRQRRATRSAGRTIAAGTALAAGLALVAGCTKDPGQALFRDPAVPAGAVQLVSFNSCDDALGKLKKAAREYLGPWGFGWAAGSGSAMNDGRAAAPDAAAPAAGAPAPAQEDSAKGLGSAGDPGSAGTPDYSGTNTHEAGVDEPDIIKTDGRRIITVSQGLLRVVDARSRRLVGELDLRTDPQDPVQWAQTDLLLQGDRALVLIPGSGYGYRAPLSTGAVPDRVRPGPVDPAQIFGPRLVLVELSAGAPLVASSYTVDGELIDARQVGSTARVVVRSGPRLMFDYAGQPTDAERLAANRAVIDAAGPDEWLPRFEVTSGGTATRGRVSCNAVSRPATYTGTTMVSVLSFDLDRPALTSGDPVTVVADGDTVYSNGPSLYIANDQRWRSAPVVDGPAKRPTVRETTDLYKFETAAGGRPRYVAAGTVGGSLLNQYSLSEWDDHLRVATTTGSQQSTVYALRQQGKQLVVVGKVTGLGKGERIYAVRFVGPVGYVVTFRQTDPLYTVDLHNPTAPKVLGELKIPGYSAYLHPVGDGRLIGIGQAATDQGRVQGTQVSLFDVSNLSDPKRLAQFHLRYGHSEAEFDPHAFLYWPQTGLLVVPVNVHSGQLPASGALVLKVGTNGITELGTISHPWLDQPDQKLPGQIRRSLVIGDVLWTLSSAGLKANDIDTLDVLAWLPWT